MTDNLADPLLEEDHRRWIERLDRAEITPREAQASLEVMRVRRTFLHDLLDKVEQAPEFANQCDDIRKAIDEQEEEIRQVENYLMQKGQSST